MRLNGVNAAYWRVFIAIPSNNCALKSNRLRPADFMRFLFRWHGLDDPGEGEAALQQRLLQLEGLCLPAISWEADILPARIHFYLASDLDKLCSSGKITWLRLQPPAGMALNKRKNPAGKSTSISFISRANLPHWRAYCAATGK